ncbi:MAG: DUF370 domain-containing protein [Clostridiales bacterium]|nr:DUF370 domain-containing protein [Clostridiales bacterium]
MYLHLGRDVAVSIKSIVGVFDLDTTSYSKITRTFLADAEKSGCVINVSDDVPKSFVLCEENGKKSIYISQISSATLLKRAESDPLPDNILTIRG